MNGLSFSLVWLLPMLNPVFYSFFAYDFRQRFERIFKKTSCCKSKGDSRRLSDMKDREFEIDHQ